MIGFIKPIQHLRWLSNIVLVEKKNGQIRCYMDFRNLNWACPKDEFSLPNMDLLIDSVVGHTMFSFMVGFNGYNQIRIAPRDVEKTAFRTPIENFYWMVCPLGSRTRVQLTSALWLRSSTTWCIARWRTSGWHYGEVKKVWGSCKGLEESIQVVQALQVKNESTEVCFWSFCWEIYGIPGP